MTRGRAFPLTVSYNYLMRKSQWRQVFDASQVGIQLVVATFVGLGIGWFIDKHLHTFPWFTIIFFFMGIVTGFIDLFRFMKRSENEEKKDGPEDDDPGPGDSGRGPRG